MSGIYNITDFLNQNIDIKMQEFFDNKYLSTLVILFISLYAGLVAIKIPKQWSNIIDSHLFKLICVLLIGYITTKNYSVAIVLAIAFLITMNTINKHKINEKIMSIIIIDSINHDTDTDTNTNIGPIPYNVPNTTSLFTNQIMENSLKAGPIKEVTVKEVTVKPIKEVIVKEKTVEEETVKEFIVKPIKEVTVKEETVKEVIVKPIKEVTVEPVKEVTVREETIVSSNYKCNKFNYMTDIEGFMNNNILYYSAV